MISFSRSQAATAIFVALLFLSFNGWQHCIRLGQSSASEHLLPLGIIVEVRGKVRAPANYLFDRSVTASEVVTRAGGLLPYLTPEPGWEKLRVANGRRLHIVEEANGVGRARLGWMTVPSRLVLGIALDVNQASAEDLAQVPGISRRLAKRIVAQRQRLGEFSRLEDLRFVDGIGPVSLERLRQYLTLQAAGRTTR